MGTEWMGTIFKGMALRLAQHIRFPRTRLRMLIGSRKPSLPPRPMPQFKTRTVELSAPMHA